MKIKKGLKKEWDKSKARNRDPYGNAVVIVTEKVGEALDKGLSPEKAEKKGIKDSDITGFQAGCVAQWISRFHPRGEEFRKWWNLRHQIQNEGEEANKSGAVLNPAILNIETK